jgi:hypothetical protein
VTLQEAIQQLADKGQTVYCVPGTVKTVNKDALTCDVERLDGLADLLDVRILPATPGGLKLVPKEGADVICAMLSEQDAYLLNASELDSFAVTVGDTVIEADAKTGVQITVGGESLGKLYNDLLSAIQKITVPTGTGPSGVPVNLADFTALQTRASKFFIP